MKQYKYLWLVVANCDHILKLNQAKIQKKLIKNNALSYY